MNGRSAEKLDYYFGSYKFDYYPIIGDASNSTKEFPRNIDVVIHAASMARPDLFAKYPVETIKPNVIGTYNLLSIYKKSQFIFFSTGSVYGTGDFDELKENLIGNIDFFNKMSSYCESKRIGELICKSFYEEYNTNAKILRIFHTFGPTINFNEDTRAFSQFIKDALTVRKIVINSSGENKRSFLYVSDAVLAVFDILFNGKSGEAYNLSNDNFIEISEFAKIISYELNVPILFSSNDVPADNNANHDVKANTEKLKKLGWTPKISINEAIRRTINSLCDNNC